MKEETKLWLQYADENLTSARLLLDNELYNPCLQNIQQAVEKALKAYLLELGENLIRTYSILDLTTRLNKLNVFITITQDDIDLLDSIYLPSKYPLMSVLPHFAPDITICKQCLSIAEQFITEIMAALRTS